MLMIIMMKIAMVIVMIVKISEHLTSTFYGPGTVLAFGDTELNQTETIPDVKELIFYNPT